MFRMTLTLRLTRMASMRELYPRAVKRLEERIVDNVQPQIERDVQELLAPYPGHALYPFQFATARSRRYYFAHFNVPYLRNFDLLHSWLVSVGGSLESRPLAILNSLVRSRSVGGAIQIDITNTDPASRFVYPPKPVPGHFNTGWNLDRKQVVLDLAKDHVIEQWGPAVTEAIEQG